VTTATMANSPLLAGEGGLSFDVATPAAACTGYADVTVDLAVDGIGPGLDIDWLQFDWDGDGFYDNNPAGRATFGVFAGPREFIYIREPW